MPVNAGTFVKLSDESLNKLISFIEEHLDDARDKNIRFFYQEKPTSIFHEMIEEIGHEWFHLGQIFVYLRSNDIPVDMEAYYEYKDPDPAIEPN